MTNTPEHIREMLVLYLRGDLDTRQANEIKSLIETDPAWTNAFQELKTDQQGIRLSMLKKSHSLLKDLEEEYAGPEKINQTGGDLSGEIALRGGPNDIKWSSGKSEPGNMEEVNIDKDTAPGIRYTNLNRVLSTLKAEESQKGGSVVPGRSKVLGMRRIWLGAIAAGLALMLVFAWPWIRPRTYAEKLIASGFIVPPMTELVRGGEELDSIQMIVQKAYGAYAEGDYKLALKYFESVPMQENEKFYLYYGITLLYSRKHNYKTIKNHFSIAHNKWPENLYINNINNFLN